MLLGRADAASGAAGVADRVAGTISSCADGSASGEIPPASGNSSATGSLASGAAGSSADADPGSVVGSGAETHTGTCACTRAANNTPQKMTVETTTANRKDIA